MSTLGLSFGVTLDPRLLEHQATTTVEMRDFAFGAHLSGGRGRRHARPHQHRGRRAYVHREGTDLAVDVPAGQDATLTLDGVTSGSTYAVICIYHSRR